MANPYRNMFSVIREKGVILRWREGGSGRHREREWESGREREREREREWERERGREREKGR